MSETLYVCVCRVFVVEESCTFFSKLFLLSSPTRNCSWMEMAKLLQPNRWKLGTNVSLGLGWVNGPSWWWLFSAVPRLMKVFDEKGTSFWTFNLNSRFDYFCRLIMKIVSWNWCYLQIQSKFIWHSTIYMKHISLKKKNLVWNVFKNIKYILL